jgi:hypothetical protein
VQAKPGVGPSKRQRRSRATDYRPRRIKFPDREFAPRQRAAFVAIHAGEFGARVGEDESEFLRPLRFHLDCLAHILRKREALLEECTGLGELSDPCMEALPGTKVQIGKCPRDQVMTRAAHPEEIDLRLRDSTRETGELAIDGGIYPFGSVLPGSGALSGLANLSRQILDFERCDPITNDRQRQAMPARIL